ncbi:MAG: methyltransferase domain-containing protein [Patescibacteria group bacterium]
MTRFLDRHYKFIRRFRFLYGWAKDRRTRTQCGKRAEEWKKKGFRDAKLDICGGRNPLKPGEFLNVDIVPLPQVDLVFDIRKRFPIDSGVIQEIFSAATLEHFRKPDNLHILREFHRVLKPGGHLRVCTPDIEAIARGLLAGDNLDIVNQHFFGKFKSEQTEDFDLHRWMFPVSEMIKTLQEIGFTNIRRIPMDIGLHDPKYNYLIAAEKGHE